MENAIVISTNEIRKILADHFCVQESDVMKSKYSWIIIKKEEKECQTQKEHL